MEIKRLAVGQLQTSCYLLFSGDRAAIIDPGGDSNLILHELQRQPVKVKFIINTHGHDDHVFANNEIKRATGADVLIHEAEKSLINFNADQYLNEGDFVEIGGTKLKVIHTPGHTPGGICLLGHGFAPHQAGHDTTRFTFRENGVGFIFTGDTVFLNGYGRTDLEWGSEEDMERSLNRLNAIIKPGMMVYPGHGEYFKFLPHQIHK